jgi:hypothetical protein
MAGAPDHCAMGFVSYKSQLSIQLPPASLARLSVVPIARCHQPRVLVGSAAPRPRPRKSMRFLDGHVRANSTVGGFSYCSVADF